MVNLGLFPLILYLWIRIHTPAQHPVVLHRIYFSVSYGTHTDILFPDIRQMRYFLIMD